MYFSGFHTNWSFAQGSINQYLLSHIHGKLTISPCTCLPPRSKMETDRAVLSPKGYASAYQDSSLNTTHLRRCPKCLTFGQSLASARKVCIDNSYIRVSSVLKPFHSKQISMDPKQKASLDQVARICMERDPVYPQDGSVTQFCRGTKNIRPCQQWWVLVWCELARGQTAGSRFETDPVASLLEVFHDRQTRHHLILARSNQSCAAQGRRFGRIGP